MIDLYDLHDQPEQLKYYDRSELVPARAWALIQRGIKIQPEALENIKRDPKHAMLYAKYILHDAWPEAEPYIAQDAKSSYYYADILDAPFPQGEPAILQNPNWTYEYARKILGNRWPAAEKTLFHGDGYWAYRYADSIMQRPWPEAEHLILKNPFWALHYARDVMQRRWPEAEPIIKQDPNLWLNYQNFLYRQQAKKHSRRGGPV